MYWMQLGMLLIGCSLLVFGYIKNNRKLLAASALLLLAAGGAPQFVSGLEAGYSAEALAQSQPAAKP